MEVAQIFRDNLCAIASKRHTKTDLQKLSRELMHAFLHMGSETPDNRNCSQHIEFGWVRNRRSGPKHVCGLKLRGKDVLVSDVMNVVESEEIPKAIQEQFPGLTPEEWNAITRITTMVLLAFQQDK